MRRIHRQILKQDSAWVLALLTLSLSVWLAPACLFGQSTALLTGTVVDPSGAVVPQAKVVCRNTQTGLSHTAVTGPEGLFRFPDLPIGVYEVTVSRTGFATQTRSGITLVTGHSVDIRIQLEVGQTAQTIQVTEAIQAVQPTSSVLQTSIESQSMRDLPLNGRNPLQLVFLTTGQST